ncbi:MAG TPA: enoyl-CoA hydratase-related protein, partial [Myxococcota bacterium]
GLVTRVVGDADLMTEARNLAKALAQGPTRAFGAVKVLLNESLGGNLETQMEREARGIVAMGRSADGREGVRAFVEKRKPIFVGG